MGGDAYGGCEGSVREVSIHAPAWGATEHSIVYTICSMFQSTPPHGGRPTSPSLLAAVPSFNPRPRMGGDSQQDADAARRRVSIHAPAWGATAYGGCEGSVQKVSIHAPAWGATGAKSRRDGDSTFQSTPPHGGRHCTVEVSESDSRFQSTPPHGGRQDAL